MLEKDVLEHTQELNINKYSTVHIYRFVLTFRGPKSLKGTPSVVPE